MNVLWRNNSRLKPGLGAARQFSSLRFFAFCLVQCMFVATSTESLAQSNRQATSNSPQKTISRLPTLDAGNIDQVELLMLRGKTAETESYIQQRVRNVVGTLVNTPFSVKVKLEIDRSKLLDIKKTIETNRRLSKLDASRVYLLTLEQMSPLSFVTKVTKISVRVSLDKNVKEDTIKSIRENTLDNLSLDLNRGDTLTIEKLDLLVEDEELLKKVKDSKEVADKAQKETEGLNQDLRLAKVKQAEDAEKIKQLENKAFNLEERGKDLFAERERTKTKLEEALKRIAELEDLLNKKSQSPNLTPWQRFKNLIAGLELPLTILLVTLVALLGLVVYQFVEGRRQKKKLMGFDAAVSSFSQSIEKVGSQMVEAAKVHTNGPEDKSQNAAEEISAEDVESLVAESEQAWIRLQESPGIMMQILKDFLSERKENIKFVQFCAGIDSVAAQKIWEEFPKEEIESIGEILQTPVSRAKSASAVLMVSRLINREKISRPHYFDRLNLKAFIKLTDLKFAEKLDELEVSRAAAALILLTPARCKRVLGLVKSHDTLSLITEMQNNSNMTESDAETLIQEFEGNSTDQTENLTFDMTQHFALLLESQKEGQSKAVGELMILNPELHQKISKRVVTFSQVLSLDKQFLSEEFGKLQPDQVAQLVLSVSESERDSVLEYFTGKLLYRIQSELKKMQSSNLSTKKAMLEGQKIQKSISNTVKKLVDEGLLEFENAESESSFEAEKSKESQAA
jgi:FliG C-terminal domain